MAGQIPLKQQAPRASSSATQLRSFRFRPPILPRWPADHGTYRYTHHRTFAQTCCSCRRTRTRTYAHIHKGMQSHTCVTIGYTCSCHYATTFSYAHSNKTATLRHSSRSPARTQHQQRAQNRLAPVGPRRPSSTTHRKSSRPENLNRRMATIAVVRAGDCQQGSALPILRGTGGGGR